MPSALLPRDRVGARRLRLLDIDAPEPMRRFIVHRALSLLDGAERRSWMSSGSYRGPDQEVHHAEGFTFRSTYSLWDTYRALHPLLILLRPES